MKSNKDVFIAYWFNSGNRYEEYVPLKMILEEFDTMKRRVYDEWMEDDLEAMPRQIYEITYLGFDTEMQLKSIEFTEKTTND